jgi:hypothetical protein
MGKALVWVWKAPSEDEQAKWIFTDPEGNQHKVSNFVGFCKEHNLDDARMYNTSDRENTIKVGKPLVFMVLRGRKTQEILEEIYPLLLVPEQPRTA